jgi:hypothetical protein
VSLVDPVDVARQWNAGFHPALPAGFVCRQALADRSVRIHSLPESKRYADSDAERIELRRRHDTVATEVLGEGGSCTLFITRYGDSKEWSASEDLFIGPATPVHVFSASNADESEEAMQFFAVPVTWTAGAFADLILAAADDRTGPLLRPTGGRLRVRALRRRGRPDLPFERAGANRARTSCSVVVGASGWALGR